MERILLISEVREKIEERKVKARRHGLCSARKTESHGVKSIVRLLLFVSLWLNITAANQNQKGVRQTNYKFTAQSANSWGADHFMRMQNMLG